MWHNVEHRARFVRLDSLDYKGVYCVLCVGVGVFACAVHACVCAGMCSMRVLACMCVFVWGCVCVYAF